MIKDIAVKIIIAESRGVSSPSASKINSNPLLYIFQGGTIAWKPKQLSVWKLVSRFHTQLVLALRKQMPLPDGCNSLFHKNFIFFRKIYPALIKSGGKKNL